MTPPHGHHDVVPRIRRTSAGCAEEGENAGALLNLLAKTEPANTFRPRPSCAKASRLVSPKKEKARKAGYFVEEDVAESLTSNVQGIG